MELNEKAIQLIHEKLLPHQNELGIKLNNMYGVNVIDFGIDVPGSWKAGLYFTEISLCGFGEVKLRNHMINDIPMVHVEVFVDQPAFIELMSHVAFWRVFQGDLEMNFSGPVRSVVHDDYSNGIGYVEDPQKVVICLQLDHFPSEEMFLEIIKKAERAPEHIYLMVAPTASIVGSLQVPARNVEQVMPTLLDKKFNMSSIIHACGISPINAIVDDEMEAYGRVNDCLIYGQVTNLYVDCTDEEIMILNDDLTMDQKKNNDIYGVPFKKIFSRCNNDWCQVPRNWDAPCSVVFHNIRTGSTFHFGRQHTGVLIDGFLGTGGRVYE